MSRYSLLDFQEKINLKYPNEKIVIDIFNGVTKHLEVHCNNCKEKYCFEQARSILIESKKAVCKKCNSVEKVTREVQNKIRYVLEKNKNFTLLNDWNLISEPLYLHCNICGQNFNKKPRNFLEKQDCPYCAGLKKTHQDFLNELNKIYSNEYTVLEEYNGNFNKILVKHSCGFVWKVAPHNLLYGKGCPKCSRLFSKGSKKIMDFLKENCIKYYTEYNLTEPHLKLLRFDFFLPEYNTAIEFQGEQHYKPIEFFGGEKAFEKQVENDNKKRIFCLQNNINLIEISYKEMENINTILVQRLFRKEVDSSGSKCKPSLIEDDIV